MKSVRQILQVYNSSFKKANRIKFTGTRGYDVYNITAPIKFGRVNYILGRVESRAIETGTRVMFFRRKKNSNYWVPAKGFPMFNLQDPFFTKIGKDYVLGGVEIEQRSHEGSLKYRTVFYRGKTIKNLKKFANGPWGMKDIRLIKLRDGKIGVFTRPQGRKGGMGRIGFTVIDSLAHLSPRRLTAAPLLKGIFVKGEWGGVNEVHMLSNGKIGVLGHIARWTSDKRMRFYYPMVFAFDPDTREISNMRILVRRAELPEGEAKRADLYNVIFPGGLIRKGKGEAVLYAGVGDAEAYKIWIHDPFDYYEENF